MPLPKPSKMISKRFKKPKATFPPLPSPLSSCKQPWRPHPFREWKIRVVCTDPDATDDSSSDEGQPSSPLSTSSSRRKRLIRELYLPLPFPSLQRCRRTRHRSLRSSDLFTSDDDAADLANAPALHDACPPSPLSSSSVESAYDEEFARFLREFLPDQEDEDLWKQDVSRSQPPQESGALGEMLDLEFDSEALSWIDSMQRLP